MPERSASTSLRRSSRQSISHTSSHEDHRTLGLWKEETAQSSSTPRAPSHQSTLRPSTKIEPSYFPNPSEHGQLNQNSFLESDWQYDSLGFRSIPSRRGDFSSVDLGSSLRRAPGLTVESNSGQRNGARPYQQGSDECRPPMKKSESSDNESELSNTTSTSGSINRMGHRGGQDMRMFDKSGAPLEHIHLEQKKGPKPYSYQEFIEKAESEAKQKADVSSPSSDRDMPNHVASLSAQEPLGSLEQDRSARSHQARRKHHSSQLDLPTPTIARPEYPRDMSAESTYTISTQQSTSKGTRNTRTRKSDPEAPVKGSKEPSLTSLGLSGGPTSIHEKSGFHGSRRSSSETKDNSAGLGSVVPPPSEKPVSKPKRSFAHLFSKDLAVQPEEGPQKEGSESLASSSSKSSVFGGHFKQRSGRRSNRSSERIQDPVKRRSEEPVGQRPGSTESDTSIERKQKSSMQPSVDLNRPASAEVPDKERSAQPSSRYSPHASFPAIEAMKVSTPPALESRKVQKHYFDFVSNQNITQQATLPLESDDIPIDHDALMTPAGDMDRLARREGSVMLTSSLFHTRVDHDLEEESGEDEKVGHGEPGERPTKFEIDVPDHLPSSPLCPLNKKGKNGVRPICPLHGRKKTLLNKAQFH